MKEITAAVISLAVAAGISFAAGRTDTGEVPYQESDRIIQKIYDAGIPLYKQYRGIESLRTEIVNEYDPETSTLRRSTEAITRRKDFYYAEPEIKVIECKTDGKEVDPTKFRIMKSMPTYPVFDEQGRENYTIRVAGKIKINGRECYQLNVEPKKVTPRHFSGKLYFTADTLESVMAEGTLAKLSYPIKEFGIKLYTKNLDGVPVVMSGEVRVRVNVPVFYPDTLIVTTITVKESSLIR